MALRLVVAVAPADGAGVEADAGGTAAELGEEHRALEAWTDSADGGDRYRLWFLVDADRVEGLLEALENRFASGEGFRVVLLPVEAALPPPEEPEEEEEEDGSATGEEEEEEETTPGRVSREELHAKLSDSSEADVVYLVLIALSALVCAFGLLTSEEAVVIGGMVIAPLLGPVIAVGLSTTLADPALGKRAVSTSAAGLVVALAVSVALGALVPVDPSIPGLAGRSQVELTDLGLSLAAGAAGTLAFTAGTAEAVIGVMVAVALVPPLVTGGLLLGAGLPAAARGGFLLAATNLVGLNLASVATFLLHGVRPSRWWEARRARRATRIALISWTLLAILLAVLISFEP